MAFIRTTAINKILQLRRFIRGVQGGTSAGKTYAIIPILIDIAARTPMSEISVVAESIPHLKRGAMKDFQKIMIETGRWHDDRFNMSDRIYTFANGSQIEFFSADNDSKLRGARRDWLYMNEMNNMSFDSYNELVARTKMGVYCDWNPTNQFWFHDELINDNDVDFLIINYTDNEACPESALNFILKAKEKADAGSAYWQNWYRVYGLGEIGSLEGVVFSNWSQCDKIPPAADFIGYGLDWGFTNDPTAIIAVYRYDGKIYVDELCYRTQLTNAEIVRMLKQLNVTPSQCIVADSAEPKSITELMNAGFYVEPARKGPDSIKASIDRLQQYEIVVTKTSLNLIKELRQYRWARDRDGRTLNAPEDVMNHAIDALRYVGLNKLSQFEALGEYSFAE